MYLWIVLGYVGCNPHLNFQKIEEKRGKPEKRKGKKENQVHNSHAFIWRFIFMFIHVCDFKNMLFSKKIT